MLSGPDDAILPAPAPRAPARPPRGVPKRYGHVEARRGVDLVLRRGEIHGLLGDNGAGKSTLLKVAAGAVVPDAGRIIMNGSAATFDSPLSARRQGIETVYQDLALALDRDTVSNVFIGRELTRSGLLGRLGFLDRRAMRQRAVEQLRRLEIPIERVTRPVYTLSGGQRQGVAIARAAMWAQGVVLLDEPTAALGVRQRGNVTALIRRLRDQGFAVAMVSHDIPDLLQLADVITVLRLGEVVATRASADVDVDWVVNAMVKGGAE